MSESQETTRIFSYIIVAVLGAIGMYILLQAGGPADKDTTTDESHADKETAVESSKIPIGDSPVKGPKDAPVTIVEFSDFQCPFCSRVLDTLDKVEKNYDGKVKFVFKQLPLRFHDQAEDASKIALAAHEQGKFWEMHDALFEKQSQWKGKSTQAMKDFGVKLAKDMGLDVDKFKKDFESSAIQDQIEKDKKLAKNLKARGTPHFFVNGVRIKGAQRYSRFKQVIDKQLKEVKKLEEKGLAKPKIYKKLVAQNYSEPEKKKKKKKDKKKKKKQKVSYVPVSDGDFMKGNTEDPLVTIVEFSDFQCPFCSKLTPKLNKVMKNYGDKVRLVFKQYPLPFHGQAEPAAKAAIAAGKQGKFWEMHDLLFKNQKKLKQDGIFKKLAEQAGLNVDKFVKDMESSEAQKQLDEDKKLGKKVGVRGTPNTFVNGLQVSGARGYRTFKSMIDKEIKEAKKLKKQGLEGEQLYKKLVKKNQKEAEKKNAKIDKNQDNKKKKKKKKGQIQQVDQDKLTIGDSPVKGPKDAPVTIIEFADFECPYCGRAHSTFKKVLEQYPDDKIQVAFKHYPLPFHKKAKPASRAAMAAGEQGKFWEMYDLLFENQSKLGQSGLYTKLAKKIGLNVEKFKKDLKENESEYNQRIKKHMKQGRSVGVKGTPAFFINGKRLVGAQPASKFKQVIESELGG